jgi:hypothetical protein
MKCSLTFLQLLCNYYIGCATTQLLATIIIIIISVNINIKSLLLLLLLLL